MLATGVEGQGGAAASVVSGDGAALLPARRVFGGVNLCGRPRLDERQVAELVVFFAQNPVPDGPPDIQLNLSSLTSEGLAQIIKLLATYPEFAEQITCLDFTDNSDLTDAILDEMLPHCIVAQVYVQGTALTKMPDLATRKLTCVCRCLRDDQEEVVFTYESDPASENWSVIEIFMDRSSFLKTDDVLRQVVGVNKDGLRTLALVMESRGEPLAKEFTPQNVGEWLGRIEPAVFDEEWCIR